MSFNIISDGVGNRPFSRDEVKALARPIRRHPTKKEFHSGCNFHADTLHIILAAMATLPSLEVATLGLYKSESSHFEHPEALKQLLLSPSLRTVFFDEFTFCGPLCRAWERPFKRDQWFRTCPSNTAPSTPVLVTE